MKVALPLFTKVMIGVGQAFIQFGPFLFAVGVAAFFSAWRIIRRRPDYQIAFDRRLFSAPVIGKCYTTLVALRFARTLALLLRGGVGLVESVALSGSATGSSAIRAQSILAAEEIKNGAGLSEAVGRVFPLGPLLTGIIQIGENSGALEDVLQNAGERFRAKWEQQLARIMAWLEPLLILGVGLFVLLVVVSILLPILSLNRQIM
jgi:general secretion pathway protein F